MMLEKRAEEGLGLREEVQQGQHTDWPSYRKQIPPDHIITQHTHQWHGTAYDLRLHADRRTEAHAHLARNAARICLLV